MVKTLAGLGVPHEGICLLVKGDNGEPISTRTLTKHFELELETGRHEANAKVAKGLFQLATAGENVTAMIFWLKTRARWSEQPTRIEFPGPDGKPQAIPTMADFARIMAAINGKGGSNQDEA